MAKVFATCDKCVPLRRVCDILNAVLHFAREARHFSFCVCSCWICVLSYGKKRTSKKNVCERLKKTVKTGVHGLPAGI